LETLVSESVILQRAEEIVHRNPNGVLASILNGEPEDTLIESVFKAARQGDAQVKEMLEERAYYLGVALANLINLFNPDLILLGGIFSRGEDLFVEPITRTIQKIAFGGMGKMCVYRPPALVGRQVSLVRQPWPCYIFSSSQWNKSQLRKH
jgi:glucokinase